MKFFPGEFYRWKFVCDCLVLMENDTYDLWRYKLHIYNVERCMFVVTIDTYSAYMQVHTVHTCSCTQLFILEKKNTSLLWKNSKKLNSKFRNQSFIGSSAYFVESKHIFAPHLPRHRHMPRDVPPPGPASPHLNGNWQIQASPQPQPLRQDAPHLPETLFPNSP